MADDNRKIYDPSDNQGNLADTTQIIQEQMERLRLAFFGAENPSDGSDQAQKSSPISRNNLISDKDNSINKFDEYEEFSVNVDLGDLDKNINDEETESKKVDLTEKMCKAFGSNIEDIGDDFSGFEIEREEENEAADNIMNVTENKTSNNINSRKDNAVHIKDNSSKTLSSNSIDRNASSETPSLNVSSKLPRDSSLEKPKPSNQLDFSTGNNTFNFGLPKNNVNAPVDVAKVNSSKKDSEQIDVFAPPIVEPAKVKDDQPVIDLNAPVIPKPVALVTNKEETKELEDWLDSVLDD